MSTVEYVESLKQRRYNLLMALGNFAVSHDEYERTAKQYKAVCDELSFYGV